MRAARSAILLSLAPAAYADAAGGSYQPPYTTYVGGSYYDGGTSTGTGSSDADTDADADADTDADADADSAVDTADTGAGEAVACSCSGGGAGSTAGLLGALGLVLRRRSGPEPGK